MAPPRQPSSRISRMRHAPLLVALSLLSITTFLPVPFKGVEAQAGKFASRPKLVDNASKKKKNKKVDDDGESYSVWRFGRQQKIEAEEVVDVDWTRDLFAAEFHLILMSILSSGLIAVLSWVWYRTTSTADSANQKPTSLGEKGGECMSHVELAPFLSLHQLAIDLQFKIL